MQLASAVKMVHKAGMAVRCLDPSENYHHWEEQVGESEDLRALQRGVS